MTIIDKLKTPKGKNVIIIILLFGFMYQCTSRCDDNKSHKRQTASKERVINEKDSINSQLQATIKKQDSVIYKLDKEKGVIKATLDVTNKQNEQLININKKSTHITISTENKDK